MKLTRTALACGFLAACGRHVPAVDPQVPGSTLLGRWEYVAPRRATPAAPRLGVGLLVTIELDSATHDTAYGRVTRWFAGDVGIPARRFGPVTAVITRADVTLTIPHAAASVPPMVVRAARVAPDTLAIRESQRDNAPGPFAAGPGALFVRTAATVRR